MYLITEIVMLGVFAGCVAAWLNTLADKRGWLTNWQANAPNDTIWELLSCNYCKSWWISLAVCLVSVVYTGCGWLFFAAFVGTMIGKKMLD